jgi:uncharacterized protein
MHYRKFGNLDWEVSALGFGCMRLPTAEGDIMSVNIDEDEAIRMIRLGIDRGVNYVDTAYLYHGGKSEVVVGKALEAGYREKVKLATKSPIWFIRKPEDFDRFLDEQLTKLKTDHIDFYLLHGLGKSTWDNIVLKQDVLHNAEKALADGRISHLGFSFHDTFDAFKQIVDGYDHWEFCQIQYNYMDTENQAGTKGLKYAASKGLPVVVMEPLLGGKLSRATQPVQDIFDQSRIRRSPSDWALQWLWSQPEVTVVLSGMTTLAQVEANLDSADRSSVHSLSAEDLAIVAQAKKKYAELTRIPCTRCSYCMPCPNGVDIPRNFEMYNAAFMYEDMAGARYGYKRAGKLFGEKLLASSCVECRICEEKCPQKIEISQRMKEVAAELGK